MKFDQDMANSPKVIVELGMGDGRLLKTISENDHDNNSFYIGIEVDKSQYEQAISQIKRVNVKLLNGSFTYVWKAKP